MKYCALTDVGKKRSLNEDGYIADGNIFAVADGMGGHRAGEVASIMALDIVRSELTKRSKEPVEQRITNAIKHANQAIHKRATKDLDIRGMGTTLTVAVPSDGKLYAGHVGDSRLYLLRDGKLSQLTNDHSLVAQMVKSGHLKPEEAEVHPQRSIITRAVGSEAEVKVDTIVEEILFGDRFLLCTDGLNAMLSDDEIAEVLRDKTNITEACRELISWANDRGGKDNITVILFEPDTGASSRFGRLWRMGW
ncbi:MAG: Stp1/IreP family PP2C-type Ser/Thr phosphatase [Firmicutes bacterium]|nr:Stp1/IreP family PP2C-type Ser/Thr phosphatase [Bacillota bacterium]